MTNAAGTACIDGLIVGDAYTITETDAPTGYDPTSVAPQTITAAAAECDGAGTPAPANFSNDPLSKLTIEFESLAGIGVTVATSVVCSGDYYVEDQVNDFSLELLDDTNLLLGDDVNPESVSMTDLPAGTYTCVIVIDP